MLRVDFPKRCRIRYAFGIELSQRKSFHNFDFNKIELKRIVW